MKRPGYREIRGSQIFMSRRTFLTIRAVMLILFIASFFSIYIGMDLESTHDTFSSAAGTEYAWMMFLPLPIPLANLVLGIVYKRKGLKTTKNIVVGIIFTFLLCSFGSFTFVFNGFYSHNMSYVDGIASEVRFTLPDKGSISTEDLNPDVQDSSSQASSQAPADPAEYHSISNIEFTDPGQISAFEASLKSSRLWVTSMNTTLSAVVPMLYFAQSSDFDYFMVYNVDLGTYNTFPDKSGTYRMVYIAYDTDGSKMVIGEYSYHVVAG